MDGDHHAADRERREAGEGGVNCPLVACFDPGYANFGWGLVEGRRVERCGVLFTPAGMDIGKRLDAVAEQAGTVIDSVGVDVVAAEEQWRVQVGKMAHGKTTHNALWQAQVVGILRGIASWRNIPFLLVTPDQLRKSVGCSSKATKNAILTAVQRTCTGQLPRLKKHNHAADAIAVGVAAGLMTRTRQLAIGEDKRG